MVVALPSGPWEPRTPRALGPLCAGCRAQGARGAALAEWLKGVRPELEAHREWLYSGVDWDTIAASCPAADITGLRARLGSDLRDSSNRTLFLTALSTRPTYEWAWGLALGHARGATRARLLKIRAFEDRANEASGREVADAEWLCRGLSTDEFENACAGRAGQGEQYRVVSLTPIPRAALKFALRNLRQRRIPHVVAVLDAALALRLGARPTLYALALDALWPKPQEERAHRASKMLHADEAQAHFDLRWPAGSRAALRAVAAVGEPSAHDLKRLGRTGVPVVALEDLL